ncbi:MAG TPA: uracil-DNA glycosylase, partial [Phenylobacterium sp.]|nr:uracil-DNA glycosylase [Phenylobacterium sp.]
IAPEDPFRALRLVAPEDVKVVVIGQDPYPTAGHADGLAFSAGKGRPRSLARMFEVLAADRPGEFQPPEVWKLDAWALSGVLLLNPVLTVEVGATGSHLGCGWQALTVEIVQMLSRRPSPPTFLLWGAKAQAFWASADPGPAPAYRTRHPSYDFDRAFMSDGSHFEATSDLIDWWAIGRKGGPVL